LTFASEYSIIMFLYDWKKIFDTAEKSPYVIYIIFRMMVEKQIPKNKYDKIYALSQKDFVGESFLLNPEALIFNSYKYTYREIAQYLALASLRPYADYLATGKLSLDLFTVEIDQGLFNENSLLYTVDNELYFLYEEVPSKEKLH